MRNTLRRCGNTCNTSFGTSADEMDRAMPTRFNQARMRVSAGLASTGVFCAQKIIFINGRRELNDGGFFSGSNPY